jgi:DNA integrity scanning protein DisA with diadenylate cyclase activity
LQGTVKELAQLDGAFVITEDGTVVAACRYLDAPATGVDVPLGLGTRHLAAASASKYLGVVALVVSQTGVVRVFCGGEMVGEMASAR